MNYSSRLDQLRSLMQREQLDGLVYGVGPNLRYFTGLPLKWVRDDEPTEPLCLLVVTADNEPHAIVDASLNALETSAPVQVSVAKSRPEVAFMLKKLLQGPRIGTSTTAHDYIQGLITEALSDAECIDAEALGEELRMCKDQDEIAQLTKMAELTDQVMELVVPHIKPGITQLELQKLLAETGRSLGAETVSFPATAGFVKSGTEPTDNPFVYPLDEGLVPGSSIAFDFGFIADGYCSDFGRSFYCGPAPDHISGAYRALQDGQCYLIEQMKPGVKLGDLFGILEAFLDERGYGKYLRARLPHGNLGHQIGVDLHENQWVRRGNETILKPGMVMCLEPKLWMTGEYYLRVEDMVLVTETGAKSLTSFDRKLFELPL